MIWIESYNIKFCKIQKQEKLNYTPVKRYFENYKKLIMTSKFRRMVTFRDIKMKFGEIHKYT